MQKALLTGFLAVGLMAPVISYAQPAATPPARTEQQLTLSSSQVAVVAAAAVVSALAFDALGAEQVGYLVVGGIAGYLATIWYDGGLIEVRTAAPKT